MNFAKVGQASGMTLSAVALARVFAGSGQGPTPLVLVALHLPDRHVKMATWTLGVQDDAFSAAATVHVGHGKVQSIDLASVLDEFCLAACTDTGTTRLRCFRSPTSLDAAATGSKVRTGATGGGRLILDTGLLEVSRWEFDNLSDPQSPITRVARGGHDGMAGNA